MDNFNGSLTASHDFLITDAQHADVLAAHAIVLTKATPALNGFKTIWAQARRVLEIIVWIPLPKAWKAVLAALLAAGDVVAEMQDPATMPPIMFPADPATPPVVAPFVAPVIVAPFVAPLIAVIPNDPLQQHAQL